MASPGGAPPPPHRSDLFLFDTRTLQGDILLHQSSSLLEYHEYAVFRVSEPSKDGQPSLSKQRHISHRILSEEASGERLLHLALREDHALDVKVGGATVYPALSRF